MYDKKLKNQIECVKKLFLQEVLKKNILIKPSKKKIKLVKL